VFLIHVEIMNLIEALINGSNLKIFESKRENINKQKTKNHKLNDIFPLIIRSIIEAMKLKLIDL